MTGLKQSISLTFGVLLLSGLLSFCHSEMTEMSLAEKAEVFAQLSKIPLSKNPFFIKSIANSGQYDGEGTEGLTPDITGHSCRWIGNMECKGFNFQCDGQGVVDCTGDCPGDEDAVGKMITMMEDKELIGSFPLLAQMKAESEKDPEKARRGKERFVQILKNCNYGGLVALVGLSDGIDFGGQMKNDSLTFVDDEALSGFAYDYEDETTPMPEKSDKLNETKTDPEPDNSTLATTVMPKDKMENDKSTNENQTMIKNMPVKESASKESRILEIDRKMTTIDLVKTEVRRLRSVFLTAVDVADGIITKGQRTKRSSDHVDLLDGLIKNLKRQTSSMRRRIRSVAENMTPSNVTAEAEKCKVQNISCAIFPTTAQCSGIALGGCMSHRKLLASLFTPRVIMFVIGGLLAVVAIAVGVGFFISKRKTMQLVEPVEQLENANTQKP